MENRYIVIQEAKDGLTGDWGKEGNMRILVDADAAPRSVKHIISRVAKERSFPVTMFTDTSHFLDDSYDEVVTVDKQRDSVDMALINRTLAGDIVVTQDYGLAALALGKGARVLNQNGLVYTAKNIDKLLLERHISQKVRRAGGRTAGPPKRTREDDEKFEVSFRKLIE